jgi:plastocyanin
MRPGKIFFVCFFFMIAAPLVLLSVACAGEIVGRVTGENGVGIAQAVVFVQELPPGATLRSTPQSAVIDQIHKEFIPPLLPISVGTEVRFPNHDQIHHHVYSFSRTKNFELPLYKGEDAPPVLFDKAGVVKIGCNIHDWMSAIILVLPTPYYAVTDETGRFTLGNLPPGVYTLACWHELSQSKLEDTVQRIQVDNDGAAVAFTLSLGTARVRPPVYGGRRYQ